jgi:hypothetical protein
MARKDLREDFDPSLVDRFLAIGEKLHLKDAQLAGVAGLSPTTIYIIRCTKRVPRSLRVRSSIKAFLRLNSNATRVTQLRVVNLAA